jgi:hypothetical protein
VGDDLGRESDTITDWTFDKRIMRQPFADGRGSRWFVTRHGLRDELLGFLAARGLGAHCDASAFGHVSSWRKSNREFDSRPQCRQRT